MLQINYVALLANSSNARTVVSQKTVILNSYHSSSNIIVLNNTNEWIWFFFLSGRGRSRLLCCMSRYYTLFTHVHFFSKSNLEDAFDFFITQIHIFYLKREDKFHIFLLTDSTISIFLIIRELFIVFTCINRPQGEHVVGPLADDLAGEHLYSGGPDQHHWEREGGDLTTAFRHQHQSFPRASQWTLLAVVLYYRKNVTSIGQIVIKIPI